MTITSSRAYKRISANTENVIDTPIENIDAEQAPPAAVDVDTSAIPTLTASANIIKDWDSGEYGHQYQVSISISVCGGCFGRMHRCCTSSCIRCNCFDIQDIRTKVVTSTKEPHGVPPPPSLLLYTTERAF
jgi:hypothetical protein